MKDLLYRPQIRPQKEYMSDAEIEDDLLLDEEITEEEESSEASFIERAEDTSKKIEEILDVADILPKEIRETIEHPLRIIMGEIEKIVTQKKDPGIDPVPPSRVPVPPSENPPPPSKDPVPPPKSPIPPGTGPIPGEPVPPPIKVPPTADEDEGGDPPVPIYPSIFPRIETIPIEVIPPVPIVIKIQETYQIDLIEVYRDFVLKLRRIVEQYIQDLLYISNLGGFESYDDLLYEYNISSLALPDHLKHMGDYILKSQISRNQKARMLKKVYNLDQTIYHLRSSKAAAELRQRYYKSEYRKADGYLESETNNILRGSRKEYDQKYFDAVKNFYKYLNGSSILVDRLLKAFVNEAKGKASLFLEGVDIHQFQKDEEALREKENKLLEDDYRKSKEEYEKQEKEKIEAYKKAGISQASADSVSYSSPGGTGNGEGGANSSIAEIALRWVSERGVKSSNPVKYSMEYRGGDMDLKRYGDCSSFARKVCLEAGKEDIGYTTASQVSGKKGTFIAKLSDIQVGDLMYFSPTSAHSHSITLPNGQKAQVAHVGIFVGNNKFVDLAYGTGGISTKDFSANGGSKKYVTTRFIGAKRY